MSILIVGNVLKDVYLNLDSRTEQFESDKHGIKWLDLAFNASEHHFFSREASFGGAAVSLETLHKLGILASVSGTDLRITDNEFSTNERVSDYRYILISDEQTTYFAPSDREPTTFTPPAEAVDYLYIDRSANLTSETIAKITAYLDISLSTKLIIYLQDFTNNHLLNLTPRASLIFLENHPNPHTLPGSSQTLEFADIDPAKLIQISDDSLIYQDITEPITLTRINTMTHLSAYSIAAATILGSFILGHSVENSLKLARINLENSKLNATLPLAKLEELAATSGNHTNDLELIAANLLLPGKGILAADESGGSIHKKFAQLNIPDTPETRRDYRNLFFTTDGLTDYVSGVILFDETTRQHADNGQTFTDYLISKNIIPGIKVDQGLANFPNSTESYTNGLDGLDNRLSEYYQMGLRFAKWRAAFEIHLDDSGNILTPTDQAISENCRILAEYATKCQAAGIVPIVEPEVVHDGYYTISQCASVTGKILGALFAELTKHHVNLRACILKTNMILAGKQYDTQSTPDEVGAKTAEILKSHVPSELAGIVFLSGGQSPEQATDNLAAIANHGPFPWPVTFSFARALQDPALYAWNGDNSNAEKARQAFKDRLIANCKVI